MKKTCIAAILVLTLSLSLVACSGKTGGVYVQNVGDLSGFGITDGDRFPGVVVAENVTKIQRDADKTVGELFVKAGDTVKTGDQLFSYDTEQLQLNLDKQKLEQEQLEATIENYKDQISELESDPWIWTAVRNDSSECICLSGNRAEGNTHDRGYRNHLGDASGGEYLRGASHKENDSFYCDHSHWYHRIFVVGL